MKRPHRYRFLRLWHRRHRAALARRGYCVCLLGPAVAVTVVAGRMVSVLRY